MPRNTQVNPQNDELLLSEDQCSTPDTPANQSQSNETDSTSAESVSREEFERLQKERDSLFDRLARLQAEFENFRKRNAREQAEFREYATAEAAKNFLPVLDNFNLALKINASDQNLRQGVELIRKQMEEVLAKMGVEAIPAEGEQFDPRLHEAIEMVDTTEVPDHQIIEELQRGYRVKDRLLRPAMVRVARNATSRAS
jgi:molecular chaperone GrpE